MIERYTRPEMQAVWTAENRFRAWLEVEILACEAWAELGVIPREDVEKIRANASFNLDRIREIEKQTRHDVVAFTRSVSESLGEERKWVHYGLTSTDVVDTANSYLIKQANGILRRDLENFREVLKKKAQEHKYTIMMGRTHGVHAEPTTFGLKLALWYAEMERNQARFAAAAQNIEVGKISGAVGTYANIDPFVETYVCEKLGLAAAPISTQTLQRDRHAEYLSTLALIATSLEKFATEIRALQKSEVREVEEYFHRDRQGPRPCPTSAIPSGRKMCRALPGSCGAIWFQPMKMSLSGMNGISPIPQLSASSFLMQPSCLITCSTVFPRSLKN
jgi:adenylosuccinate lyase